MILKTIKMTEIMKKVCLIPETLVRVPSLTLCQLNTSDTPADPTKPAESKERYEEEEKGFGQYQW